MPKEEIEPIISEIIEENQSITKHIRIGFTRLIILWKISKGPTYGYDLMKTVDEFFSHEIELGLTKKANSSKIYPILKRFEKSGVITGEWEIKDNKRIKIYKISDKGILALKTLKEKFNMKLHQENWKELADDIFED